MPAKIDPQKDDAEKTDNVLDNLSDFIESSEAMVDEFGRKRQELSDLTNKMKDHTDLLLTRLAIEFGVPFDDQEKLREFIAKHKEKS
jgi:hypothetical protein